MADEFVEFTLSPEWKKDTVPRSLWADTARVLERGGKEIERIAKRIVPIRDANLISTIRSDVTIGATGPLLRVSAGGEQGSGSPSRFVDYAVYVEEGTGRGPRQPFMLPALEQASRLGSF